MKWLIEKAKAAKEACARLWNEYGTPARNGVIQGAFIPVGTWLANKACVWASTAWSWFTGAGTVTTATKAAAVVAAPLVFV
jgi:hypothetical protein